MTQAAPYLRVFDDVLPDPHDYRAWALQQPFKTIVTGDETWRGIALLDVDDVVPRAIASRVPEASRPALTFLRQSPLGQEEPNYVHSDEGMGEWTGVLYLNPQPADGDGTTFWRFKPTGDTQGSARGLDKSPDLWEPWRHVEARFNRLVVFDSLHFHSRSLEENYGDGDGARLVQVAFGPWRPSVRLSAGVRLATVDDVPALVAMGCRFRQQSVYAARMPESVEHMRALAERLIASPDGVVLVADVDGAAVGMLGLMVYPHHMTGASTAGELFFWVEPAHRGVGLRLLRSAERWATAHGATAIQMIAPTGADDVEQLYQRLGYGAWEVAYVKELDACQ